MYNEIREDDWMCYLTDEIKAWLMDGDPSIQYLLHKDILKLPHEEYQKAMEEKGWVKDLIDLWDKKSAQWGKGIYGPKWISTTYTMLDLKSFEVSPDLVCYQASAKLLMNELVVNRKPKSDYPMDLCICGMLLNLCCYAKIENKNLYDAVDAILNYHMKDGAWNCRLAKHPNHSSLHTTINVLEGLLEYKNQGYSYRLDEINEQMSSAHEFILQHHLYLSDRTGEVIKKQFTMLSYPPRWKYDILRALDYFRKAKVPYDSRMDHALELLKRKRTKEGLWPVQQKYAGLVHFDYEQTGKPSRINTLRAIRVLNTYG